MFKDTVFERHRKVRPTQLQKFKFTNKQLENQIRNIEKTSLKNSLKGIFEGLILK